MNGGDERAGRATEDGLALRGVVKSFATRGEPLVILRGVTLELSPGESAAIVGPSGSGKSTLLHVAGTLEQPTRGEVRLGGANPFELGERELAAFRNRTIGFVFQDHHLLPQCSALENVLLPTLSTAGRGARATDQSPEAARTRATALLERVGLATRAEHRPAELSGGERQRVAIARALINRPKLLLADEPTGNLDQDSAAEIAALFGEIHRQEGTMLLVVTHSPALAERMQRRFELRRGELAEAR